ncbi:HYR domain-containing protein [Streptomyces sp. NPDC020983]|uniref:HYR domain-containing protein n=1 Tax=Streptomyces sp. NPDC020983 TaxID=3365106 RepID=UPI00378B33A9
MRERQHVGGSGGGRAGAAAGAPGARPGRSARRALRLGALVAGLLLVAGAAPGMAAGRPPSVAGPPVNPQVVDQALAPGESTHVAKTVATPTIPPRPDVVLLIDDTGSMKDSIANVASSMKTVATSVLQQQPGARFALTAYGDVSDGAKAFTVEHQLTSDVSDMGGWFDDLTAERGYGSPGPAEDWINGLWQIAGGAGGRISFRPEASPIVVLIGDASSHDPSLGHPLDDTIDALRTAGVRVLAVDIDTDLGDGLDGNGDTPNNHEGTHDPDEATKVVTATGGKLMKGVNENAVAQAIGDGLVNLPTTVTYETLGCDPALTVSLAPASRTVTSGETASFDETVAVSPDAPQGTELTCAVQFLLDGRVPGTSGPDVVTAHPVRSGFRTGPARTAPPPGAASPGTDGVTGTPAPVAGTGGQGDATAGAGSVAGAGAGNTPCGPDGPDPGGLLTGPDGLLADTVAGLPGGVAGCAAVTGGTATDAGTQAGTSTGTSTGTAAGSSTGTTTGTATGTTAGTTTGTTTGTTGGTRAPLPQPANDYQEIIGIAVRDVTAPVVTVDSRSVEAQGSKGAHISYTATAVDGVDGPLPVACTPVSGSLFPLGATTVTCTATDSAGNTGTAEATFTVLPKPIPNQADLAVHIGVGPAPTYTGASTLAQVTITNAGPRAATGVVVSSAWPATAAGTSSVGALTACTSAEPCTIPPGGRVTVLQQAVYHVPLTGTVRVGVHGSPTDPRTSDNTATAPLRVLQPKLALSPAVVRPGDVVVVRGTDFPPGSAVPLSWSRGLTARTDAALVAPDGTFTAQVVVLARDLLGVRELRAAPAGYDPPAAVPVLVVQQTVQPPDFAARS